MKTKKLGVAVKVVCIILACLLCSFVLTVFMTTGYVMSNLGLALAAGNTVTGDISEKYVTPGAYHLVVSLDGYEPLDYLCSESEYLMYSVGDKVSLGSCIVISGVKFEEG